MGSGSLFVLDVREQLFAFAVELLGGLVVGQGSGDAVKVVEVQTGLERAVCGGIGLALFALIVDRLNR